MKRFLVSLCLCVAYASTVYAGRAPSLIPAERAPVPPAESIPKEPFFPSPVSDEWTYPPTIVDALPFYMDLGPLDRSTCYVYVCIDSIETLSRYPRLLMVLQWYPDQVKTVDVAFINGIRDVPPPLIQR